MLFGIRNIQCAASSGFRTLIATCICLTLLFLTSPAHAQTEFSKLISWGQLASSTPPTPPGNCLPHIDLSYQRGYDGVEIDISYTADYIPVVSHGYYTNGSGYGPANYTLHELQTLPQFSLGTWEGAPIIIPSLEQALRTNGTRGLFVGDMRVPMWMIPAVSNAVQQAGFDEELLAFSAYTIEVGQAFKDTLPQSKVYIKTYEYPSNIPPSHVDDVAAAGLDGIMIQMPEGSESIQEFVDYVHCKGLRLILFVHYAWNTLPQLQRMVDVGADYILTVHDEFRDDIDWLEPDPAPPVLTGSVDSASGEVSLSWQHQRPYAHRLQVSSDNQDWVATMATIDCTSLPYRVNCRIPMSESNTFYRLSFTP